jgi:hypothetical protein
MPPRRMLLVEEVERLFLQQAPRHIARTRAPETSYRHS